MNRISNAAIRATPIAGRRALIAQHWQWRLFWLSLALLVVAIHFMFDAGAASPKMWTAFGLAGALLAGFCGSTPRDRRDG